MVPAFRPFIQVVPIILVSSFVLCNGNLSIEQFMAAVKQQHEKCGEVKGEWVLDQWSNVQSGGMKAWIEAMNSGVELGFEQRSPVQNLEGPEPPTEMSRPSPTAVDSKLAPADHTEDDGPSINSTTGYTKNIDERGPLLVTEVLACLLICCCFHTPQICTHLTNDQQAYFHSVAL